MAPTSDSKLPRNDPAAVQGELFEGSAALAFISSYSRTSPTARTIRATD